MIKEFENYTLLAGNHGRRGSIWRGPDHLLVVEGGGVLFALSESYRRIDYENIQALSLVRTQRYGWLLAAFLSPLLLMGIILFAMAASGAGTTEMSVVMLLFGMPLLLIPFVLLIVHLARGRTVRCTLQTAVQNLRLRPLTREAKAQRVMAQIAELCRGHQGETVAPQPENVPLAAPQPWQVTPAGTLPVWNGSPAVIVAGIAVFLWGAVFAGELFVPGTGYITMDILLGTVATIAAVIALVFALRHHSPGGLQASLWISSGLGLLIGFCGLVGLVIAGSSLDQQRGDHSSSVSDAFQYLADLSLEQTRAFGWIIVGLGVIIALLGLAMLPYGARRRVITAPVPPPFVR